MASKLRATSALFLGTSLALALPLHAQERNPSEASQSKADVPAKAKTEPGGDQIVVTGTRIRGAKLTSEEITLDRESIVDAGQVDLGEALRSLPQNFAGGQNPGVGAGAGLVNQNINAASSPDLRGLGPDATLTLLNGHRLSYDSVFQGVDISAIPLAAVDRVEIVPDGASALYGSDAIGGVVNVILRPDFEGIDTSAQIGTSTDGGYFRQQADIVGGARWNGGGFMVAYDFAHNSQILARQRSFATSLYQGTSLYPETRQHAVTMSAHQDILPGVEASIDAVYSNRTSSSTNENGNNNLLSYRAPKLQNYTLAPSLKIELGADWQATISGVYGRDRTEFYNLFIPETGSSTLSTGHAYNEVTSLEAGFEGPLFALPGGSARLALGAGLRNNRLNYAIKDGIYDTTFDVNRRANYAYAELYLPLVAPKNRTPGIDKLALSAAVRYEDYPGLAKLATPRFGLTYAPIDGLTFNASWARSFKAPTLYQQYIFYEAILLPAAWYGIGTGSDALLYAGGGNPSLQPETARSWTAGINITPRALPELSISATYFDIAYNNRVVMPLSGSLAVAFANPGYASLITRNPDPASQAALIGGAIYGLENYTSGAYDPANVVALLDNRNVNAASWAVHGIDARIGWNHALGQERSLSLDIDGTWLDSHQQLTPALPSVPLSGTVFNPPRYRMRGTLGYRSGGLSANAAINYIDALVDTRFTGSQRLSPTATFDLGLRYVLVRGRDRDPGLELSLTIQNLFNLKPETIGQTGPTDFPYDSTNYSPIGRFIAIGIRRHW